MISEYRIWMDFKPEGKKRHRTGKFGIYAPSKANEIALAQEMKHEWCKIPFTAQITCDIRLKIKYIGDYFHFKRKLKENEIHISRKRRCDVDNYEKFVLDAFQKSGIIKNDVQIIGIEHELEQSAHIYGIDLTVLPGGFLCQYCGSPLYYENFYEACCKNLQCDKTNVKYIFK